MERLTYKGQNGKLYIYKHDDNEIIYKADVDRFTEKKDYTNWELHDRFLTMGKIAKRLSEYEDTSLTPKEAADLARAKAEGRLVVLPVSLGSTAYVIENDEPKAMKVEYFGSAANDVFLTAECKHQENCSDCESHYGETCAVRFSQNTMAGRVYLTREEAEKALEVQE